MQINYSIIKRPVFARPSRIDAEDLDFCKLLMTAIDEASFVNGLNALYKRYGKRRIKKVLNTTFTVPVQVPKYTKQEINDLIEAIKAEYELHGAMAQFEHEQFEPIDGLTVDYYAWLVGQKYGYDRSPFNVMWPTDEDILLVDSHF